MLALLLLSGVVLVIPLATPVHAANSSLPTFTLSPNVFSAASTASVSFKIKNPNTNAFAINGFTLAVPTGWTLAQTGPASTYFTCTGSLSCVPTTAGVGLPPALTDTVTLTVTAPTPSSFPVTASMTSSVQDASSSAYYAGPSTPIYQIDPATTMVVTLTSGSTTDATQFTAGSSAITATVTVTGASSAVEAGVPVAFSFSASSSYKGTVSPTTGTTGSTGTATSTFTPSNKAPQVTCVDVTLGSNSPAAAACSTTKVTGATGNSFSAGSVQVTTLAATPSTVLITANFGGVAISSSTAFPATHYDSTTNSTGGAIATNFATIGNLETFYSIADAFGNPVSSGVTLGAGSSIVPTAGFLCSAAATPKCTTSLALGSGASSGNLPAGYAYYQSGLYGTTGTFTVALTGTYVVGSTSTPFTGIHATTGSIITGTFGTTPAPVVSVPTGATYTTTTVPAGSTVVVKDTPSILQQGVPVALFVDKATSTAKYAGTFTTGTSKAIVTTDSTGLASSTFNVDTKAGRSGYTKAYATAPTDANSTAVTATSGDSNVATTVAGTASTFLLTVAFAGGTTAGAFTPATTNAVGGSAVYIDVGITDAYGNTASNTQGTQIQITLSASAGTLSATSVYIPSTSSDTAPTFGPVTWTMPSGSGTAGVLTASGVLSGVSKSTTATVTTVSPLPIIAVTTPKPLGGFIYSNSPTVVFTGQANASLGYIPGTLVTRVGYKIGAASWKSVTPSGSANPFTWVVSANLPSGVSTIQFNATDAKANTAVGSAYQVLVDTSAPTIVFTTANGASLTTSSVAATITDTLGDLNTNTTTSVTAKYNTTAITASSISVTGTNNPGSSVTYTVTISGLPTGHWTITLNAKDLSGNAATPVSITVTISVPTNTSFSPPSPPVQSTQSGFTGVSVSWTNNLPTTQTVNAWTVVYNSKNQVVFASLVTITVTASSSTPIFTGLSSSLPSGAYTAHVFVVSTSGTALSLEATAAVSL